MVELRINALVGCSPAFSSLGLIFSPSKLSMTTLCGLDIRNFTYKYEIGGRLLAPSRQRTQSDYIDRSVQSPSRVKMHPVLSLRPKRAVIGASDGLWFGGSCSGASSEIPRPSIMGVGQRIGP
nr:hypothetical protein CFP56_07796 [Quercus suber]